MSHPDQASGYLFPSSRTGGFSLVELVIVIIVIGILASMALPKLGGGVSTQAADANAQAVAGALGAAAANYNAMCTVGTGPCTTLTCSTALALVTGINTANYTVGGSPAAGCTIRYTNGGATTYTSAVITP